jgi:RNA polymerase sigma-70 factor (ECF subfamily)
MSHDGEASSSFNELIDRLKRGDSAAAAELFDRFAPQLLERVRPFLDQQTRRRVDEQDVVQSVFKSFFREFADGQFTIANWQALWGLLFKMARRKAARKRLEHHAQRRDASREIAVPDDSDAAAVDLQISDTGISPPDRAALAETLDNLLRHLDGPEQDIFVLRLGRWSVPEISQRVGRSERTVMRVLTKVRRHLEDGQADDGAT